MSDWDAQLRRGEPVEIGYRRLQLVVLLLVALPLGLMGAWYAVTWGSSPWVGILVFVLFGPGSWVFLRRLFHRGPAVVVDAEGVRCPGERAWDAPWPDILGTRVFEQGFTTLVLLRVTPERYRECLAKHPVARLLAPVNRLLVRGARTIALPMPLACNSVELSAWLGVEAENRQRATAG